MARKFAVSRHAKGWAVYDDAGSRVSEVYNDPNNARTVRDRMQRQADRQALKTTRPCLCCGTRFESEGIHNRLCGHCRGVGLDMQMVG